jgi:hypothetical protein
VAEQVYPGGALIGEQGPASRIALWRFRGVPRSESAQVVSGLRAIYEGQPVTAQVRLFQVESTGALDLIGIIELYAPWVPPPDAVAALGSMARYVDLVNTYAHYAASEPIPGAS